MVVNETFINEDSCSCREKEKVIYDAWGISIVGVEIQKFKTTIGKEVGFVKKIDVDLVFLNELQKLKASLSNILTVLKENSGINHGN